MRSKHLLSIEDLLQQLQQYFINNSIFFTSNRRRSFNIDIILFLIFTVLVILKLLMTTKHRPGSPTPNLRQKFENNVLTALFGNSNRHHDHHNTPTTNNPQKKPQHHNESEADVNITKAQLDETISNIKKAIEYSKHDSTLQKSFELYKANIGNVILASNSKQEYIHGYQTYELKSFAKKILSQAESIKEILSQKQQQKEHPLKRNAYTKSQSTRSFQNTTKPQQVTRSSSNPEDNQLINNILTEMFIPSSSKQTIKWTDIAGLQTAKRALQETIILPLIRPDLFMGLRSPAKGLLLYGPPGTGKTMLAKAAASESNSNFFSCSASSLTSKWMGEAEKLLKTLFQLANEYAPSILFFDELDAVLSQRKSDEHEASRRFKTEFMIRVDGISSSNEKVLVLGCTNCPWDLDEAILRRFQRRIYVPLPDEETRRVLLNHMLENNRHSLSKEEINLLIKDTEGYSCSDLKGIGREAAFGPLRSIAQKNDSLDILKNLNQEEVRGISYEDFQEAIRVNHRTVSEGLLKKYRDWERQSF